LEVKFGNLIPFNDQTQRFFLDHEQLEFLELQ